MTRTDADVASLRADWGSAYGVACPLDPPGDLPFKAVPRADAGALLETPSPAAPGALIRVTQADLEEYESQHGRRQS